MAKNTHYAGFWLRVIAYIIDAAVISLLGTGVVLLLFLINVPEMLANVMVFVLTWLYFAFFESSEKEATLGKLAVGLKVTDLKGKRLSFLNATGRHFGKYLSMLVLFIGMFMIAFTQKKQGLHDLLAKTLVLRKD